MEQRMGYKQILTTKLVRKKHQIGFMEGGDFRATTAISLRKMLENVPDEARIDEVLTDDEGGSFCTITFHEEHIDD